jgi:hypothetical protein
MRAVYPPERVRTWTSADLVTLTGKYVDVAVPASEEYRRAPGGGGDWEGGSGICVGAVVQTFAEGRLVILGWDWGMTWMWPADEGAWVSVCDEHGDHKSVDGEWCLMNMGPTADQNA